MAYLKWSGLDDLYKEIQRAGETAGEATQKMLEAGGQECVKAWQTAIGMHGHGEPGKSGRATGEMMRSVGIKFRTKNGMRTAEIYPLGKDRHGVRNAEKAFILHYGSSKIQGDHFVDEAEQIAEENAIPVMQETWDKYK